LWQNDRGLAAVELVIVAPVLIALLGGIVQTGSLIQAVAIARNAAREGARYASVGWPLQCPSNPTYGPCLASTNNNVKYIVNSYLSDTLSGRAYVQLASDTVTLCYPTPDPACAGSGTAAVGQPALVTVTVPLTVAGQQINVTSSATMEILQVTS